jgi:hypothetical protein
MQTWERWTAICLVGCAALASAAPAPAAEPVRPDPDDRVRFTFAVFGDNNRGGRVLEASLANMQKIKPAFVVGMGDHVSSRANLKSFEISVRKVFGSTDAFYPRFYITAGDNEAQAFAGRQDAAGAERPFFHRIGLFDKQTDRPARDTVVDFEPRWFDYYARLRVAGTRVHLVSLYDQDSVPMHKETVAFANRVCKTVRAERKPSEPWIVFAHDGTWWKNSFRRGHDLYACDLLLGASWHVYACFGAQGGGTNLAFNTSAVGQHYRGPGRSWYAVLVLVDKLVLLNIDDRRFTVKGRPGCHVKPLGRRGFDGDPAAWFEALKTYARGVKGDWGPLPAGPSDD